MRRNARGESSYLVAPLSTERETPNNVTDFYNSIMELTKVTFPKVLAVDEQQRISEMWSRIQEKRTALISARLAEKNGEVSPEAQEDEGLL